MSATRSDETVAIDGVDSSDSAHGLYRRALGQLMRGNVGVEASKIRGRSSTARPLARLCGERCKAYFYLQVLQDGLGPHSLLLLFGTACICNCKQVYLEYFLCLSSCILCMIFSLVHASALADILHMLWSQIQPQSVSTEYRYDNF